jgi:hypothetical protein
MIRRYKSPEMAGYAFGGNRHFVASVVTNRGVRGN